MTFLLFTFYLLLIQATTATNDGPEGKQSLSAPLKQRFTRRAPKAQRERGSDDFSTSGIGPGASSAFPRRLARTPNKHVLEEQGRDLSPLPTSTDDTDGNKEDDKRGALAKAIEKGREFWKLQQQAAESLPNAKTQSRHRTAHHEQQSLQVSNQDQQRTEQTIGDSPLPQVPMSPASATTYTGRPSEAALHSGIGVGASSAFERELAQALSKRAQKKQGRDLAQLATPAYGTIGRQPHSIPNKHLLEEQGTDGNKEEVERGALFFAIQKQKEAWKLKNEAAVSLPNSHHQTRPLHRKLSKPPLPGILKTSASAMTYTDQPSGAALPSGIGPGMASTMQRIKIGEKNQQLTEPLQREPMTFSTFRDPEEKTNSSLPYT